MIEDPIDGGQEWWDDGIESVSFCFWALSFEIIKFHAFNLSFKITHHGWTIHKNYISAQWKKTETGNCHCYVYYDIISGSHIFNR